MKCRFVGSTLDFMDGRPALNEFGQAVDLTPEELADLAPRAALLPDELFQPCGFTEQELQDAPVIAMHTDAMAAKRSAAWAALHQFRESIAAGEFPLKKAGKPAKEK